MKSLNQDLSQIIVKAIATAFVCLLAIILLCLNTGCSTGYSPAAAYGWQAPTQGAYIGVHTGGGNGAAVTTPYVQNGYGKAVFIK